MDYADEIIRRIETLESRHSGIGSEVAVVKAEVGTMQRDINFLRTSVDTVGVKLDAVLQSMTMLQAQARNPREQMEWVRNLSQIVLAIGAVVGMIVGGISFVSKTSLSEADIRAALAKTMVEHRMAPPAQRE
jgi:hypothetical protein